MKNYMCPKCKSRGNRINYVTVDSLVEGMVEEGDYLVCQSEECEVVYFNKIKFYELSDLKVQVCFKNNFDEECPICYCSNLTRKEIKEGVNKGYKTIEEIREFTDKKTTGKCLTKNPLGKCCHKAFQREIDKYK